MVNQSTPPIVVRGVLAALAAATLFFVLAGSASAYYVFNGSFSEAGGGPGQISDPGRAALQRSTGDLFVVDSGNDRVEVFAPNAAGTAEYLAEFGTGELSEPWGIAIDEQGGQTFVYVADAGNDRIVKYSDEASTPNFSADPDFTSPSSGSGPQEIGDFHSALAIDPTSHDLLVADEANKLIDRFEDDGTFLSSFNGTAGTGSPGAFAGPVDLAVNSTGDIYVVDANGDIDHGIGTSRALRYSPAGSFMAELTPVGAEERPAAIAIAPGDEVVVSAQQGAAQGFGTPSIYGFNALNQPTETERQLESVAGFDIVSGMAVAGSDGRLYVVAAPVELTAFGSVFGAPAILSYRIPQPAPPEVGASEVKNVQQSSAMIAGAINPHILSTTYWVEYGTDAGYGRRFPVGHDSTIKAVGETAEPVFLQLSGLRPETEYHFRLVAENLLGTTAGTDLTFRTRGAVVPPSHGPYELVSPAEKGSGEIQGAVGGSGTVQSTPDGSAAAFPSLEALGGTEAAPLRSFYRSSRTDHGWLTTGFQPPQQPYGEGILQKTTMAVSRDLSRALVVSEDALAPGAVQGQGNLYLRDAAGYEFIATSSNPRFFAEAVKANGSIPLFTGGTPDLSTLLFQSRTALTPEATEGVVSLYRWKGGTLRVIKAPGEPEAIIQPIAEHGNGHPVSEDGSRIFFAGGGETSASDGRRYLNVDEHGTVRALSVSRRAGETGTLRGAEFVGASSDGSVVWFLCGFPLTEEANVPAGAGGQGFKSPDLYRYDLDTGELKDETAVPPIPDANGEVLNAFGVSDDGETVYFTARADLAPGSTPGAVNLYRRSQGQTRLIVTLEESDRTLGHTRGNGTAVLAASPDGRYLAFAAYSKLGYENRGFAQIQLYDAVSGTLECASCDPTGAPATGEAELAPAAYWDLGNYYPRSVDNAGTVFFNTPNRLVVGDVNGVSDAYEFSAGRAALISTGKDPTPSYFADASADGSSVFFKTRQRLVGRDTDNKLDLYVAREGGGFVEPPEPSLPCEGEACQGAMAASDAVSSPGSSTFSGPPNQKPKKKTQSKHKKKAKHHKHKKPKHGKKQRKKGKGDKGRHGKQGRNHQ